jgi:hypothetical protein
MNHRVATAVAQANPQIQFIHKGQTSCVLDS